LTKKQARTAAFGLSALLLVIVAAKGGAAKTIALGALAVVGAIAGIDLPF